MPIFSLTFLQSSKILPQNLEILKDTSCINVKHAALKTKIIMNKVNTHM